MPNETEGRIPLADLLVFHQLARSLTSSFDLDTILRTILEQMERMVEAELWALLMLDENTPTISTTPSPPARSRKPCAAFASSSAKASPAGSLEHGETLIVPEVDGDPRAAQSGNARHSAASAPSSLCRFRGRTGTHGVIEILNPRAEMSDYSIAFLHILADHAAIAIENARDVSRIQQLTITDDTTGLFNVRHLYEVLCTASCNGRHKLKLPVSLAFWDLDRFKLVNDVHGHLVGSELLALVGTPPPAAQPPRRISASATAATNSSFSCRRPRPHRRWSKPGKSTPRCWKPHSI